MKAVTVLRPIISPLKWKISKSCISNDPKFYCEIGNDFSSSYFEQRMSYS